MPDQKKLDQINKELQQILPYKNRPQIDTLDKIFDNSFAFWGKYMMGQPENV
jgi:hypothetical protein